MATPSPIEGAPLSADAAQVGPEPRAGARTASAFPVTAGVVVVVRCDPEVLDSAPRELDQVEVDR